ncbi:hypothetical protein Psch_03532 [Pelotomaculum schinkii]|uniref:Uncharacterized protein n=1 Tax=Pelotomaculum schinkii TaxID=78350 RepID=A0A4Y7R816_9FIRM|nr:hypothetical protein [Pelotomaculum schinkii]TEB04770.1 hypothetical protein Psch_03532 [Pelotomaculum schinkii]
MMNNIDRGKEIFLGQLKEMAEGYKTMEECVLDNGIPFAQAEVFEVPVELREAFYAYHAEFLTDHGTCTNTSGPFFDDEDVNDGIRKKYWYFYWPIVKLLNNKYPDLQFRVIIEPHYEGSSTILVVVDRYGKNKFTFPVVVLLEYVKAWCLPFDRPEEPNHVFFYLCNLYNSMEQVCSIALSIFDFTNSAKEENLQSVRC